MQIMVKSNVTHKLLYNNYHYLCWFVLSVGSMQVSSAELSHAGHYTCLAKNTAGSTRRDIQLTVQGKNLVEDCISYTS